MIRRREFQGVVGGSGEDHNRRFLRLESVAVGIVNASYVFVPVLMTRLGGTPFDVALLTAIPYVGTLFLAVPIGQHLQTRRRIVPWYSTARFLTSLPYGATALVLLLPGAYVIPAVLLVWALYSIPGAVSSVTMPMVMDGMAGPRGRFAVMGSRWSTQVLVTAGAVFLMGQLLGLLIFPVGYQVVLVMATIAGTFGAWFARQFWIPPPKLTVDNSPVAQGRLASFKVAWQARDFRRFIACELGFLGGVRLALPLIPIYFVREIGASDASIGVIATIQAAGQLIGYVMWPRVSARRNERTVLFLALPAAAAYPFLVSLTGDVVVIAGLAGLAALFTAGVDLVLFEELMRTVPTARRATFVSIHVMVGHSTIVVAPIVGAALASVVGLHLALQAATLACLTGVALFAAHVRKTREATRTDEI